MEHCIVVQAFTVPDDQHSVKDGKGTLYLSHEGVFSSDKNVVAVIRNSVVDPITGAISVKLLERHPERKFYFQLEATDCIDLTLEKSSTDDVSPITIGRHPLLIKGEEPYFDRLGFCYEHLDISDDGYARGVFTYCALSSKNCGLMKVTIDATQDRCVVVLSPYVERDAILFPLLQFSCDRMLVDGVRGRMSYVQITSADSGVIVVVDIE